MKEDVIVANIDNLRQSINELKEYIEKKNVTILKPGNISRNSSRTRYHFHYGFRNSLNYSSRSLNFLNIFIGMFAITISTVWLLK